MITRRSLLRASLLTMSAVAGHATIPSWLVRAAAQQNKKNKILVAVFQRGAADGLNMVVPFFEKRYYEVRPSIAVQAPGTGRQNGAIDLDGRFGLHPALQPLKPFWDSRQLAIAPPELSGPPGNCTRGQPEAVWCLLLERALSNPKRAYGRCWLIPYLSRRSFDVRSGATGYCPASTEMGAKQTSMNTRSSCAPGAKLTIREVETIAAPTRSGTV